MFRLISLNIDDQNYLGHIKEDNLVFIPKSERIPIKLPYTSVLIGPNGTGKSTLLKYISEIFEDIEFFKNNSKRRPGAITFPYSVKYMIDGDTFQITQKNPKFEINKYNLGRREEVPTKLFRWEYIVSKNDSLCANWNDVGIPLRIIAVSYLAMDRFRQKKNNINDYYHYLGLRQRSNAASPSTFMNNTLPLLFSFVKEKDSINFLVNTLEFMKMDSAYLGIQYKYRYKEYFFKADLSVEKFKDLFENYEKFSKRKDVPYSVQYYKRHIANNLKLIGDIVIFLTTRSFNSHLLYGKKSTISFNLFDEQHGQLELGLLYHLQKLDLISSLTLSFKKGAAGNEITAEKLSSGEFHFLTTMIAIHASIKQNALVLIDEPDTSLHPNWQMKYANHLKEIFKHWNSSHFLFATHSHFIVSDLEGDSSSVIGITGQTPYIDTCLFDYNTYGWSAEEVLYTIFEVRTTRNFYLEYDLTKLVTLINKGSDDFREIKRILKKLSILALSDGDPLKVIIEKGKKYIQDNNA